MPAPAGPRAQWIERQYLRLCRSRGQRPAAPPPSCYAELCEAMALGPGGRSARQWALGLLGHFVSPPLEAGRGAGGGAGATVLSFGAELCPRAPEVVCCSCGRIPVRFGALDCGHVLCYRCLQACLGEGGSAGAGGAGEAAAAPPAPGANDPARLALSCPCCGRPSRDLRWAQETRAALLRTEVRCRHGEFSLEEFVPHYAQAHAGQLARRSAAPRGERGAGAGEGGEAGGGAGALGLSGLDASFSACSGLENVSTASFHEEEERARPGPPVVPGLSGLHQPPGLAEARPEPLPGAGPAREPAGGPPASGDRLAHIKACWEAERRTYDALISLHWALFGCIFLVLALLFAAGDLLAF